MVTLHVEDLCKSFNLSPILNKVSFSLARSEALLLSGANGAGKSTLLACLAGTLRFDSGKVELEGAGDLGKDDNRSLVGYAGDNLLLYEQLTVLENLKFWAKIYRANQDCIEKVVTQFALQPFLTKPLKHCSLGMRRRVSLARSLLHVPKFIFWDEPFVGLDTKQKIALSSVIEEQLTGEASFIISSHEQVSFSSGATKYVVLTDGKLEEGIFN